MKRIAFLLTLLIYLACSRNVASAQFPRQQDSLGHMRGVKVLVLNSDDELTAADLTHDVVQTDVELKLRSSGVLVLSGKEWPEGYQKAVLVVRLNFEKHENIVAAAISVELWRVIEGGSAPYVSTWEVGGVGLFGASVVRAGVRERVGDHVAKFANDYLTANPKTK